MTEKWLADFLTGIWIYIIGVQEWLDSIWQEIQEPEGRERVLKRVKAHFREYVVYYVFAVVLVMVIYGLWSYERDCEDVGMARGSSQGKVKKVVMTGGGVTGAPNSDPNQFTTTYHEKITSADDLAKLKAMTSDDLATEINKRLGPNASQSDKNTLENAVRRNLPKKLKSTPKGKNIGAQGANSTSSNAENLSTNFKKKLSNKLMNLRNEKGFKRYASVATVPEQNKGTSISVPAQIPQFSVKETTNQTQLIPQIAEPRKPKKNLELNPNQHPPYSINDPNQTEKNPNNKPIKDGPPSGVPLSSLFRESAGARAKAGVKVSVSIVNPQAAPAATNNKTPKPAKEPEANQQPGPSKPQQPPAQEQTAQEPQKDAMKDQGAEGVKQAVEAALAKKGQKDAKKQDKVLKTKQIKEQASQLGEQFKRKSAGSGELNQLISQIKQNLGQQVDRIGGILFSLLTVLGLTTAAGVTVVKKVGFDTAEGVATMATRI
jgi:hypothetical protein